MAARGGPGRRGVAGTDTTSGPRPDVSFFACASVVPSARRRILPFRFEQRTFAPPPPTVPS